MIYKIKLELSCLFPPDSEAGMDEVGSPPMGAADGGGHVQCELGGCHSSAAQLWASSRRWVDDGET